MKYHIDWDWMDGWMDEGMDLRITGWLTGCWLDDKRRGWTGWLILSRWIDEDGMDGETNNGSWLDEWMDGWRVDDYGRMKSSITHHDSFWILQLICKKELNFPLEGS